MFVSSAGWERIWTVLAGLYGSRDCEDPGSGECWQYMGAAPARGQIGKPAGSVVHQFRHRCLKGQRVYLDVPALASDFDPTLRGPDPAINALVGNPR